ncbi:CHAT domain-containing protein [Myxococcus sp. MISCRS1]|uniref:CHAT domain-containing protein n=1 Tax=Myxococcus sp. MISCRS1 TaxID=2996786 RepID=UPI00226F793B|nr:CHAT domain-containing protein [Myxococcus sp. MISCRS1]MCY0995560.1 CHAT domain-containing protein [Myxococcus sp. MISCRS1]
MTAQRPLVLTITVGDDARVEARDQDDTFAEHRPDGSDLLRQIDGSLKAIELRRASDGTHQDVGRALFDFLFGPPVLKLLHGLSERAAATQGGRLQLRLVMSQDWQPLPWELLFDASQDEFLATSPNKTLYRVVPSPLPPNLPMPSLDMAVVASTPRDVESLDTEAEQQRVREALASGRGAPPRLSIHTGITRGRMNEVLARELPGVLHFMGHGRYDKLGREGSLALSTDSGDVDWVPERELGEIVKGYGRLGLVVLTACESAQTDERRAFSGVGQRLVEARIPAVIAMQYKLLDTSAPIFSQSLYKSLAQGEDIAVATQAARKQLFVQQRTRFREAFTPVLYLRGAPLRLRPPLSLTAGPQDVPVLTEDMETFVAPRVYSLMEQVLDKEHRLLIAGPPGSGKTLFARMLMYHYRTRAEPYEVRRVETPGQVLEGLQERTPVLFYLEDPWGIDEVKPQVSWRSQLPKLFRQVTAKGCIHRLLVTTRQANLGDSYGQGVPSELVEGCRALTYDDYDPQTRKDILRLKARSLTPWQQDYVTAHEKWIVERLEVPLSIDRFISGLRSAKTEEQINLSQLLHKAQVEELGATLQGELRELEWATRPALLLWALVGSETLFKASEALALAKQVQNGADSPPPMQKLIGWMETAGWLEVEDKAEGRYRAHPTTVSGLERLLSSEPDEADHLLSRLLDQLCAAGDAAGALKLYEKLPASRRGILSSDVKTALQRHVLARLLGAGDRREFSEYIRAAMEWLEGGPIHALILALTQRTQSPHAWGLGHWEPPQWDERQRVAVLESPDARRVLDLYIRHVLPMGDFDLNEELIQWSVELTGPLTESYLDALRRGLRLATWASTDLVHGALAGTAPPYDEVLTVILGALDRHAAEEWVDAEELRRARQGVLGDAHAEHVQESGWEHFSVAATALERYVKLRRQRMGYQWILEHPRSRDLMMAWGDALRNDPAPIPDNELSDFYSATHKSAPLTTWWVLRELKATAFVPKVVASLETTAPRLLGDGISALRVIASPEEVEPHLRTAAGGWTEERRAAVLLAVHMLAARGTDKSRESHWRIFEDSLGTDLERVITACARALADDESKEKFATLPPEDLARLRRWAERLDENLGRASVLALAATGAPVLEEARKALVHHEVDVRVAGVRALRFDASPEARLLLRNALSDVDSQVRASAVRVLAPSATSDERARIIPRSKDESNTVRFACAKAIGEGRWDEGRDALFELLSDSHDSNMDTRFEHAEHHIAREAARLLVAWSPHPPAELTRLLSFVEGGLTSNRDVNVHSLLLDFLERLDDGRVALSFARALEQLSMAGQRDDAHDLRWVVATALVSHLRIKPTSSAQVPLNPIVRQARHFKPLHAGIAFILLGMLGQRAHAELAALLKDEEHLLEKALLSLLGAAGVDAAPSPEAERLLATAAQAKQVVTWAREKAPPPASTWAERWKKHPHIHAWLAEHKNKEDDWSTLLTRAINVCLGEAFQKSFASNAP